MSHLAFKDAGKKIVDDNWGVPLLSSTERDKIKDMSNEHTTISLLAAAVAELSRIKESVGYFRSDIILRDHKKQTDRTDVIADARVIWAALSRGDKLIADIDKSKLSRRASQILYLSKWRLLSQVTKENLSKEDGCGTKTTTELLLWAEESKKCTEQ